MMSGLDLFETERLVLSGWRVDQVDDLMRLHGNPNIMRYITTNGDPWTREQAAAALASWINLFNERRLGKLRLTRKCDGAFIGRAGFGIYNPTGEAEMGYALLEEFHGKGYATEAAAALRDWFFEAGKGEHFIGFADTRNAPSLAVLRRIGMEPTHIETFPDGIPCQFHILHRSDWRARYYGN